MPQKLPVVVFRMASGELTEQRRLPSPHSAREQRGGNRAVDIQFTDDIIPHIRQNAHAKTWHTAGETAISAIEGWTR